VNLAMAGVMHQPHIREVICTPAVLGDHMMDVESLAIFQVLVTDGTEALLPLDEWPSTKFDRLRFGSSLSPVVLQGWVIGGIRRWYKTMPDDLGPGKRSECPVPSFILEDPSILPTPSPAPILLRSPPPRFPRVTSLHIALSTRIHETIQVVKHLLGHANAEVVAPASDQRIHLVDQCDRGRTHVLTPGAFQLPFHIFDGVRARFDEQLVAAPRAIGRRIMADVERQKIVPVAQVTNLRLLVCQS
jgi:hypothetical protein